MSIFDSNHKILIVDDRYEIVELITHILSAYNFEIIYANDGDKSLSIAIEEQPDVILMDWEMPGMDGIEATKLLSQNKETKHIPIIMATGVMTGVQNLDKAMDAGAIEFLRKPFDPVEFLARLRSVLQIKAQRAVLKHSLEQKERELAAASMLDVQVHNLLADVEKKVSTLSSMDLRTELSNELKQIGKEIRRFSNMEKSWEQFKQQFELVHPSFFSKLLDQQDKLTINEQKLCGYLKMGLSNQEITVSANIQNSTLKKALNTVKKKLTLSAEDDLRLFINRL